MNLDTRPQLLDGEGCHCRVPAQDAKPDGAALEQPANLEVFSRYAHGGQACAQTLTADTQMVKVSIFAHIYGRLGGRHQTMPETFYTTAALMSAGIAGILLFLLFVLKLAK